MSRRRLVVIPHTHWDREWYRTHEEFRVRLVALVDRVLATLESDREFRHFTLDGQTIVVDDYLAVRPDQRERIEKLVRDGRLLVGPWYVLPDEWLVSGEALIRNLRLGLARAEALGGAMRLGYVPDQFGHVGQLPQIFRRFGLESAALWRGVGSDVGESGFWWEAPDGTRVFTLYLATSYGNAANLPLEAEALAGRLGRALAQLRPFVRGSTYCLMNGSDHLLPQPGLPAALAAAVPRLGDGAEFEIGTLPIAVARVREEQGEAAPVHRGELRSGLRAPLLPGCASARQWQKQRDRANDTLLTRVLEPLAAWAGRLGASIDRALLAFTWGIALENHPHDSICGCSIDAVHAQMETRFDRVRDLARAQIGTVTRELAAHLERPAVSAGCGDAFAVWNGNAAGATRIDAELELDLPGLDPGALRARRSLAAHVRCADGRRIPAYVEVAAPGSVWTTPFSLPIARSALADLSREVLGLYANRVIWSREGTRLAVRAIVGSEPLGEFDPDATKAALATALADPALAELSIEVRRPPRLRVSFTDTLPGHGLRIYRLAKGGARGLAPFRSGRLGDGGAFLESDTWRIEVDDRGAVALVHHPSGSRIEDAVRLVSEGDRGDTYNFDPVPDTPPLPGPERVRVRVVSAHASEATLEVALRLRVPNALAPGRARRSARTVSLPVALRLRICSGLDRIDLHASGDNTARDHRLRLLLRAPFSARRFEVESAFEIAARPIAPPRDAFGSAHPAEFPIGAVPMQRFATLAGDALALTVATRGSSEVEAICEATATSSLAITLLRAVGHLSAGDLALRPGPAGPLFETPGAQAPGAFRADLSLRLHAPTDADRVARAHAFALAPAAFAIGEPAGSVLRDGARLVEIDDPGIIVSAIEPAAAGALRLRVYEATGCARRLSGRIPGASRIDAVDLTGGPEPAVVLTVEQDRFVADLRPAQIVDLSAHFG